jgi:hypothetical protein
VHVLLDRDAAWPGNQALGRFAHVHRLTSVPGRGLVAVRPDGHVGFRSGTAEVGQLVAWLTRIGATG